MTEALLVELELQKDFLEDEIETIYFGGGTPSILASDQVKEIINKVRSLYKAGKVSEITIEANPEDITAEKIKDWKTAGINRVSLGIQTLNDEVLRSLNRSHTGAEAIRAIAILQEQGLENITIDLIYGLPSQTNEEWKRNVERIVEFGIPHLSAYALTIEDKTVFGHQLKQGIISSPEDEQYEEQYLSMCEILKSAGYEHYEVSNFARPGFRSKHNQLYWQGVPYLGIGPGAHSYINGKRYFNVSNNSSYLKSINDRKIPRQVEILSDEQRYNEYLLTRLRTDRGINLDKVKKEFNIDLRKDYQEYFEYCLMNRLAKLDGDSFILTEKGFFLSDAIILELMN